MSRPPNLTERLIAGPDLTCPRLFRVKRGIPQNAESQFDKTRSGCKPTEESGAASKVSRSRLSFVLSDNEPEQVSTESPKAVQQQVTFLRNSRTLAKCLQVLSGSFGLDCDRRVLRSLSRLPRVAKLEDFAALSLENVPKVFLEVACESTLV